MINTLPVVRRALCLLASLTATTCVRGMDGVAFGYSVKVLRGAVHDAIGSDYRFLPLTIGGSQPFKSATVVGPVAAGPTGEQAGHLEHTRVDGCSRTCDFRMPNGCVAVSSADYLDAYGSDPLFQKMLSRAKGLGFVPDLLCPTRCRLPDGSVAYNAILGARDQTRTLFLRS